MSFILGPNGHGHWTLDYGNDLVMAFGRIGIRIEKS